MRITEANLNTISAALYCGCSLILALGFLAVTLAGDYDWVARLGGAAWVFALTMVILMPTIPGLVRERVTGEKAPPMVHDHDAMLRGEPTAPMRHGADAMISAREEGRKTMAKDHVCGMDVDPESAAASSEHDGQPFYFCSVGCQEEFDASPDSFAVEHGDVAEDL